MSTQLLEKTGGRVSVVESSQFPSVGANETTGQLRSVGNPSVEEPRSGVSKPRKNLKPSVVGSAEPSRGANETTGTPTDAQKFGEIYQLYYPDVLRFIARRLIPPDKSRAQDIAHETFMVCWRRMSDIPEDITETRTWLLTVARNCLRNDSRLAHREHEGIRISDEAYGYLPSPDDVYGLKGLQVDLATAWNKLTPDYQEVMALNIWDALTSAEAARVLGITDLAYRLKLSRARKTLRKHLESG